MKFLLLLLLAPAAFAQWVVVDPTNQAVNLATQANLQANHAEVLRQWTTQLAALREQLQTLQSQLAEVRHVREVLGNPQAAGPVVVMSELGLAELSHAFGDASGELRRTLDVLASLRHTANDIFAPLDELIPLGSTVTRQPALYRRFAAVEQESANADLVQQQTEERRQRVASALAEALQRMRNASTQAEVDKLAVNVAALNGQLATIDARQRAAHDRLVARQILNENQAAKERQDLLEKQVADERRSFTAFGDWQASLKLTPTFGPR